MAPVKNPVFQAEIIQYEDSGTPGSPIIASSGDDVNIIFSISREKFRKMAMALFDRWKQDEKDPCEELDSHSETNGVPSAEGNGKLSKDYASDNISDSAECRNSTHVLESFAEARAFEKDQVDYCSSPNDTRGMDSRLSLNCSEELETKTDPKRPVAELEEDSKENKSDSFSSNKTGFQTGSSNFKEIEKVYEEMKIKQCLCNETDGINEHCDNPGCQKIENISEHSQSEVQIECENSLKGLEDGRVESDCVMEIKKLNVDANIDYKDRSKEHAEKEFSDMFPAMESEEVILTEIKSVETDGIFTKYFKIDLLDEFVVLKITTSDKDFLMNTYKFKVITDSVTHADNFTEKTNLSSKPVEVSSDFSNEKQMASKADIPEENTGNVLVLINDEKLESKEMFSPRKTENIVMDASNISVEKENDVENQSVCSNETNDLIEQSLDLERSRELSEKELLECSKGTQPEECSEVSIVVGSELLDMKDKDETDCQSNISHSSSKSEFSLQQSSKAEDIGDEVSLVSSNIENSKCLNTTFSLPHPVEENSLEASEKILPTSEREPADTGSKLQNTDINLKVPIRSNHVVDTRIVVSPLEQIEESSHVDQNHRDNTDSLSTASENLENKRSENGENSTLSVAPQENLEIKSEAWEKSFSFSFSDFAEDEKALEEKPKNGEVDFMKAVEDNVESVLSGKMSCEENKAEDREDMANKFHEDSVKDISEMSAQSTEITEAVSKKFNVTTDVIDGRLALATSERDSLASEAEVEENKAVTISDECSGTKVEEKCEDLESKANYKEIVETETVQSSESNLKETSADVVRKCEESESFELTDKEMMKESRIAEDANKTSESSIDVSENDADAYEITKCVPTNDSESVNARCSDEIVGNTDAVPESVSCKIVITQDDDTDMHDQSDKEPLEDEISKDTLSEGKLSLENSIVESEKIVVTRFTESAETASADEETNGQTVHSETLGLSFISVSETSKIDNSSFSEEPEHADEESVADSETASERDILDTEDVKSVASESDDSKDSVSFTLDRNSKKRESDEVDCAPTRLRTKRSALKLSEDVIPENSVVSKSRSYRSSHVATSSKSTLKVSPASRSLRSRSLEPVDQPSKSNSSSNDSKSNNTDSAEVSRKKRATTPEVISKRDIKTAVRSSPRKVTRATSLNTEANQTPKKDKVTRSNTEVATSSNSSSSVASGTKKRTTKRSGAEKK